MTYLDLDHQLYYSLLHIGMGKKAYCVPTINESWCEVFDKVNKDLKSKIEHKAKMKFHAFKKAVDDVREQEKTDLTRLYKETEERLMPSILASDLSDSTKIDMLKWCYDNSIPFSADIYTKMADVNVLELSKHSKEDVWSIMQETLNSLEQYSLKKNTNLKTFDARMKIVETLAKRCDRQNKHLEETFARTEFALRGTQYAGKIKNAYFTSGNNLEKIAKIKSFQQTWNGVCAAADATGKNKTRKVDGIQPTSKPENAPTNVVQGKINFPGFNSGR